MTGGTDSTGSAAYNYDLSHRRADAVVQYLASKYGVAAHRFYLIGIGKDKEVAPNTTAEGRKQNRRVEVQLLSNMSNDQAPDNFADRSAASEQQLKIDSFVCRLGTIKGESRREHVKAKAVMSD